MRVQRTFRWNSDDVGYIACTEYLWLCDHILERLCAGLTKEKDVRITIDEEKHRGWMELKIIYKTPKRFLYDSCYLEIAEKQVTLDNSITEFLVDKFGLSEGQELLVWIKMKVLE